LCMRAFSAIARFTLQFCQEVPTAPQRVDSQSIRTVRRPRIGKGTLEELPLPHMDIIVACSVGQLERGRGILGRHCSRAICHCLALCMMMDDRTSTLKRRTDQVRNNRKRSRCSRHYEMSISHAGLDTLVTIAAAGLLR
jgi:hypothetical protein